MLIDLDKWSPLVLDMRQYPGTVAVRVSAPDDKPFCGVFAGSHDSFSNEEENKPVPMIERDALDLDSKVFILDRPDSSRDEHLIRRWSYSVVGWVDNISYRLPSAHKVTLSEVLYGGGEFVWNISITPANDITGVSVVLSDYRPGALSSGRYVAIP